MNGSRVLCLVLAVVVFCIVSTVVFADDAEWITNGTNIYNANSGNVGIGTADPEAKLHIFGNIKLNDSTCEIQNDLDTITVNLFNLELNDENTYGWVTGNLFGTTLEPGKQVGTSSVDNKYIIGLKSHQLVSDSDLYGKSYGIFGLSYACDGGTIHGDSISVYGQGAIGSTGHVEGDLIGVYGNVYASAGQVDGNRWAGYFNGNTYIHGSLGIGTTTPGAKLHIQDSYTFGSTDNNLLFIAPTLSGGTASETTTLGAIGWGINNSDEPIGKIDCALDNPSLNLNTHFKFFTYNRAEGDFLIERMRLTSAGNLGIGTTTPNHTLEVNGTIAAKEVKVTTAISANEYKVNEAQWSDFVFEEGYKLPSLDHVENYIKENKHLPDVPSAKQIEKDGLSMAEMMAKQMQKIEELTLYVIELKKENENLRAQSKQEMSELKAQIEALARNK